MIELILLLRRSLLICSDQLNFVVWQAAVLATGLWAVDDFD